MDSHSLELFLILALALPSQLPVAENDPAPVWRAPVEIAAGRGEKGPWRQNQSRYDYVDDPMAAMDDRGETIVAWVAQGRKDIFLQRFSPDGRARFAQPVNVSRNPATFSWLPRVVMAPGGRQVFLLWQEIIFSSGSHGGEIFFSRSLDGGAAFSEPINISKSPGGDGKGRLTRDVWDNGSLDLAAGADGTLYAAWTEYDGALWFTRSADGGASFAPPRALVPSSRESPARAPSLAPGADRTVYLAWAVGEDREADIHLAKSTDGGATFGEAQAIAPSPGHSDSPRLAVDGGSIHLVYAEGAGGPFHPHHIRYTRSADGGRSFAPPREISRPAPEPFAGAGFPMLALDGRGTLCVLWEWFEGRRNRPSALGMALSRDGGTSFTPALAVPRSAAPAGGTNGSQQGLLMKKLAVNDAGHLAIVGSSLKPGESSRVWLMQGVLPAPQKAEAGPGVR